MNDLVENEAFYNGVVVGISLFQQKIISTHKRKEALRIGDTVYYLQDGRERLQEMMEKICE